MLHSLVKYNVQDVAPNVLHDTVFSYGALHE